MSTTSFVQPTPIPASTFSSFSVSNHSSPSSLLPLASPTVLGLICQYMDEGYDILAFLRCCSTLHRSTANDASFATVAWSNAKLVVCQDQSLTELALPSESCVTNSNGHSRIPLLLWQQAVPVMRYVVEQWQAAIATAQSTRSTDMPWKRAAKKDAEDEGGTRCPAAHNNSAGGW